MADTNFLQNIQVRAFYDTVIQVSQQKKSRLIDRVRQDAIVTGTSFDFPRLGTTEMKKINVANYDLDLEIPPFSTRRGYLSDYNAVDVIDSGQLQRIKVNPYSSVTESLAMAAGRTYDQVIIDAAVGSALTAVNANDSTSVALPASQIIVYNSTENGNTDSNLSLEKLITGVALLDKNEVDRQMERMTLVAHPDCINHLMTQNSVISSDYNVTRVLNNGVVEGYMGMKFVRSTLVPGSGTDADPYQAIIFSEYGIGLARGDRFNDKSVVIRELPQKRAGTFKVEINETLGAVRVEEARVVAIECSLE